MPLKAIWTCLREILYEPSLLFGQFHGYAYLLNGQFQGICLKESQPPERTFAGHWAPLKRTFGQCNAPNKPTFRLISWDLADIPPFARKKRRMGHGSFELRAILPPFPRKDGAPATPTVRRPPHTHTLTHTSHCSLTTNHCPHGATSVRASVCLLILAVRAILSQLKGLPSMARLRVLKSTTEKTCR
jgi:hypothetical protein